MLTKCVFRYCTMCSNKHQLWDKKLGACFEKNCACWEFSVWLISRRHQQNRRAILKNIRLEEYVFMIWRLMILEVSYRKMFLAAISSSRSDHVTQFVSSSGYCFLFSNFLAIRRKIGTMSLHPFFKGILKFLFI